MFLSLIPRLFLPFLMHKYIYEKKLSANGESNLINCLYTQHSQLYVAYKAYNSYISIYFIHIIDLIYIYVYIYIYILLYSALYATYIWLCCVCRQLIWFDFPISIQCCCFFYCQRMFKLFCFRKSICAFLHTCVCVGAHMCVSVCGAAAAQHRVMPSLLLLLQLFVPQHSACRPPQETGSRL